MSERSFRAIWEDVLANSLEKDKMSSSSFSSSSTSFVLLLPL